MNFSSAVIEESCSKDENESEIESEKLVESSTEKENKEKEEEEDTPVVVRRRPKKTPTQSLPPGKSSRSLHMKKFSGGLIYHISLYCFNSLAIRLWSKDLKHLISGNRLPKLQG